MATVPREARLVAYGVRRAALLRLEPDATLTLSAWASDHGLHARCSGWAWRPQRPPELGGYSNLMHRVPAGTAGPEDVVSVAVAADAPDAVALLRAEDAGDDAAVGALLGYPDCCTRAFAARWPRACRESSGDVAGDLVQQDGPGPHPYATNVLVRYLGASLVEHFPCRWSCRASLVAARRHEAALARFEPQRTRALRQELLAPVLWSPDAGVVALRGSRVRRLRHGWQVHVDPHRLRCTAASSRLAAALRHGPVLSCSPTGSVPLPGTGSASLVMFTAEDPCATSSSLT